MLDVVIIGSGPAGGSAGLQLAKAGLSTLILEEHPSVGEPVHCGECLSKKAIERFDLKIPKEVVSVSVKGIRTVFPDESSCKVTEPGVVLEKHLWEQYICDKAQDLGAELKLEQRVRGLVRHDDHWRIDTTKGSFKSKILIDASGVQSVSNSILKLNPRFKSVIGIQYEMRDIPQDDYLDFYLWPDLAPQGYLWMIPKSEGRANVGLVTSANTNAKQLLDKFVRQKKWDQKPVIKTFGGLIPASGAMAKTVSEGLMLVGDAAGFTSPLFEGGNQLGLMSGKLAAQTAVEALAANDVSEQFLKMYETRWKQEFPPYEKILQGKELLHSFSNTELNELGVVLPKEMGGLNVLDMFKVGVNLVVSHRGLLQRKVWKVFDAFKYSRAERYGW